MPPEEVQRAADRWRAWMRWYIATYPDIATEAALARALGMGKPALNRLLKPGSRVIPKLPTLLAAEALTGFPLTVLLHQDPPALPGTSR